MKKIIDFFGVSVFRCFGVSDSTKNHSLWPCFLVESWRDEKNNFLKYEYFGGLE